MPALRAGAIGIIPTDTIYGIVGSALDVDVVERIYAARERNYKKPCIILISSIDDLQLFKIELNSLQKKALQKLWLGKNSVILDCQHEEFAYLHKGTDSLAFRLPKEKWLRKFLVLTGPLIAPSANPEGRTPATDIAQAKAYFGEKVDFYVDFGELSSKPSNVVRLKKDGLVDVLKGK